MEPLEVADVVVLAERVWTNLQLRARCAARVSAPKDCATEVCAAPQAAEIANALARPVCSSAPDLNVTGVGSRLAYDVPAVKTSIDAQPCRR